MPPNIKELVKAENRILLAAEQLFWEKGYLGTSVNDIAKVAGVNKATIYYYFESKMDLLYQVILISMKELLASSEPIVNSALPLREKFKQLVENHVKWRTSHIELAAIAEVERRNLPPDFLREYMGIRDEYEVIFRKMLKELIETGEFREMNSKIATFFTLGLVNSLTRWYRPDGPLSADEIGREASKFIFEGIDRK